MKPLLSLGLLAAAALAACAPARVAPADPPPRLDHILLEVKNLEASIRFYRDLMGLDVKARATDFVTLQSANVGVFLWAKRWDWEAPRRDGERPGLGMYPHWAVPDVRAKVEQARQAGYRVVQGARWHLWGTEAFVADPDGYVWALISD